MDFGQIRVIILVIYTLSVPAIGFCLMFQELSLRVLDYRTISVRFNNFPAVIVIPTRKDECAECSTYIQYNISYCGSLVSPAGFD